MCVNLCSDKEVRLKIVCCVGIIIDFLLLVMLIIKKDISLGILKLIFN